MSESEGSSTVADILPNSFTEIVAIIILSTLGIVSLLNPNGLYLLRGINPDPIVGNMDGFLALLLFISAIIPALATDIFKRYIE